MTKLGFINKFILQWFFIRLTRCTEEFKVIDNYEFKKVHGSIKDMGNYKTCSIEGTGTIKTITIQWYSIMGWILPTSGWGNDFKYLNKSKESFLLRLTSKKLIDKN